MIPAGFEGVEAQLWLWMIAMIRPGAAFLAAPVFGAAFVPVQLRLVVALAIGIPALAVTDFTLPDAGLVSIYAATARRQASVKAGSFRAPRSSQESWLKYRPVPCS